MSQSAELLDPVGLASETLELPEEHLREESAHRTREPVKCHCVGDLAAAGGERVGDRARCLLRRVAALVRCVRLCKHRHKI